MKLRNVVIGLFVGGVVAGMAWFARGVKECRWRSEQGLHIRWNVDWFSNQYERISKLGDEDLRHDYVTNFTCHACTLLNLACKTAPNTSNLVERYYIDWTNGLKRRNGARRVCDEGAPEFWSGRVAMHLCRWGVVGAFPCRGPHEF